MQQMYNMIMTHKRAMQEVQLLWKKAIKQHQHEYDSDEEVDNEFGTWEHQLRRMEMDKTREWAEELTEMGRGKHFIGDFLPPDELEKFMETLNKHLLLKPHQVSSLLTLVLRISQIS
eukprot:XP_017946441.1 PREDICTED: SURP and G-patch domain-containing protein 1-like [Xenopus tropicalis]